MREASFSGTISGNDISRRRGSRQANAVVGVAVLLAMYSLFSRVSMTPENMDFATVTVGTGTVLKTVTITNHGVADVHAHPFLESANGEFQIQADNCDTIKGGASCTVNVTFRPGSGGEKSARLVLADFGGTPLETQLSGLAKAGPVVALPGRVAFDPVLTGSISKERIVRFSSSTPFHIRGVSLGGQSEAFQVVKTDCEPSDSPITNCAVALTFQAHSPGDWNAQLVVDNDGPSGAIQVPLAGTAEPLEEADVPRPENTPRPPRTEPPPVLQPGINVVPRVLTFESNKRQAVTIYNPGEAPLTVHLQLAGNNPDRFIADDQSCTSAIPAHGSCQVAVGYKPKVFGERSNYAARLQVDHNVPNIGTQEVALEWKKPQPTSQPQPHALVTPGSLDFSQAASRRVNITAYKVPTSQALTITIKNDGPVDLKNINLRIGYFGQGNDSGFSFTSNCRTLAQGAECTETVTFAPTKAKNYHETLYVFEGPLTSLGTVDLTANLSQPGPG